MSSPSFTMISSIIGRSSNFFCAANSLALASCTSYGAVAASRSTNAFLYPSISRSMAFFSAIRTACRASTSTNAFLYPSISRSMAFFAAIRTACRASTSTNPFLYPSISRSMALFAAIRTACRASTSRASRARTSSSVAIPCLIPASS
ncbi:MAG: hypothetical protein BWY90_01737 [Deltaproteobacteria bacterium ADurb.BinA014]|nr:MAG: hypothetical protein BWY90_01737 [Deltaproteobacteria bacterium ADurb.BinA014]